MSGEIDPLLLNSMTDVLAPRGPDGSGTWISPGQTVGLGHRRLAIIDTSDRGLQPMTAEALGWTIAYNGEVYNYRELRRLCEQRGHRFRTESDTEVVLTLFATEGVDGLRRCRGIYAFAAADHENDSVWLVRDRLGIKPLFYATTQRRVLFGSELKALLQDPNVDRSIDHDSIRQALSYLWVPSPRSPIIGVQALEPGCALHVRHGEIVEHRRYWDPPPRPSGPVRQVDDAEVRAEIRHHFETAVARQLVADVPVGAFLSGGTDSTAVVSAAQRATGLDATFTIDIDRTGLDKEGFVADLPYAVRAARHFDVPVHEVPERRLDAASLSDMVWWLDGIHADPAALLTWSIASAARDQGIKVLLSGAGGDDFYTGYRRHRLLAWSHLLDHAPRAVTKTLRRLERLPVSNRHAAARRARKALYAVAGDTDDRKLQVARLFRWIEAAEVQALTPELSAADPTLEEPLRPYLEPFECQTAVDESLLLDQRYFLSDHNLAYTDRMSMAASVEVRVPFLDDDLIDHAATLPVASLMPRREPKRLLRDSLEPLLPEFIRNRPKSGFGLPLRQQLDSGSLGEAMNELLSRESIQKRDLLDHVAVDDLRRRNRAGSVDAAYTLFCAAIIELWCRTFLDTPRPTGPVRLDA